MVNLKFRPVTEEDLPRIKSWIEADPDHRNEVLPEDLLDKASGSLLTFRLDDSLGPVMYVRFDTEGDLLRMKVQFGPESEVSKKRVVIAILQGFEAFKKVAISQDVKGIVFYSISKGLIKLMSSIGFHAKENNEYVLMLQEQV